MGGVLSEVACQARRACPAQRKTISCGERWEGTQLHIWCLFPSGIPQLPQYMSHPYRQLSTRYVSSPALCLFGLASLFRSLGGVVGNPDQKGIPTGAPFRSPSGTRNTPKPAPKHSGAYLGNDPKVFQLPEKTI